MAIDCQNKLLVKTDTPREGKLMYPAPYEVRTREICLEGRNVTATSMVQLAED